MAISKEKRIENALVSAVGGLTYIAANGVSVRNDDEMDVEKTGKMVNISVGRGRRLQPNYNYYQSEIELGCCTHVPNDESATIHENIYDEVDEYVNGTISVSALNTAITDTRITIDGIVPLEGETEYEENMRVDVARADIYYTFVSST